MGKFSLDYQDIAQVRGKMYAMVTGLDLTRQFDQGYTIGHQGNLELPDGRVVLIDYKITIKNAQEGPV
jgi:hypothetical protein